VFEYFKVAGPVGNQHGSWLLVMLPVADEIAPVKRRPSLPAEECAPVKRRRASRGSWEGGKKKVIG